MRLNLQNLCRQVALPVLMALALTVPVEANAVTTRIKDIVEFEGVRDNLLVGYGLVVGLNGTGDTLGNSPFTERSVTAMLERLGVQVQNAGLNTQNIAAVMVTATLPPFTNQGARIDVNISSLGDSTSLQGGTLVVTPWWVPMERFTPSPKVQLMYPVFPHRVMPVPLLLIHQPAVC